MPLSLFNTHTSKKAVFVPRDPSRVTMYVCGPTVYDRAHLGNARSAVVFDMLFRVLRHQYGEESVVYARNFTDIDDKIISAANTRFAHLAPSDGISQVTSQTIEWYLQDMSSISVLRPTYEPRATEYVNGMVEDIAQMVALGGAYPQQGHVFFYAQRNMHNGSLSGRTSLDDPASHRIEPNPLKEHPADFVLWKPSTDIQPGWESPWGRGRPGWHIECSTMSTRLLGKTFDIHGGGSDLVFPHHDNEISQAMCCNPTEQYAATWLHNGMITVDGRKMSKSLGNFITVEQLRQRMHAPIIRMALLSAHYRASLDWTDSLEQSQHTLWARLAGMARHAAHGATVPDIVMNALLDDMNTPLAISHLSQLYKDNNAAGLRAAMGMLGIGVDLPAIVITPAAVKWINNTVDRRAAAKRNKQWAEADRIRLHLNQLGVELTDTADGTSWVATKDIVDEYLPISVDL